MPRRTNAPLPRWLTKRGTCWYGRAAMATEEAEAKARALVEEWVGTCGWELPPEPSTCITKKDGDALISRITPIIAQADEAEELQWLFDLQHRREREAIDAWRAEKPGRELTLPD